jgi:hypothetical protein
MQQVYYISFSLILDVLQCPDWIKKSIAEDGGMIKIDEIELQIGAGCLVKSTEIALIPEDQNVAFKSLLDVGLIHGASRIVHCFPDGLKFVRPVELEFKFEKPVPSLDNLFVLYGSYNRDNQHIVWELMNDDITDKSTKGFVKIKINGFSCYSWISADRGKLARILCHLNNSFTCRAYAFYRRLPSSNTIDISVVILSKFVDERAEDDIKQLKDHFAAGYIVAEKGMLKRVHTKRLLEISLDFPGLESTPFSFKIDQPELDEDGFVVDHFNGIAVNRPAKGKVRIGDTTEEHTTLWTLNVLENEEVIENEDLEVEGKLAIE